MARVLVTRPEPGAARTALRLQNLGYQPVLMPLTKIVPLDPVWPGNRFDAVLATSANAFVTSGSWPHSMLSLPVHVVGSKTAEAAHAAGFGKSGIVASDANALLARLSGNCGRGGRLAYLCGRVRKPELETGLAARGYSVTAVETYDTVPVSYLTDNVKMLAGPDPLDAVLVMSAEAAKALMQFLQNAELAYLFENTKIICISDRVAEALALPDRFEVRVAGTPDEAAMLRAMRRS